MPALLQSTNSILTTSLLAGKNNVLWILLGLFLMVGGEVFGQNGETTTPTYTWVDKKDMGSAGINSSENIVIALDKDSSGKIYALTFGGKVLKFDQDGNPDGDFQLQGEFEGLVDMAINSNNEIFVAHYEGREVLAFNINGNPIPAKNEDSDYFKPLGLAFDKEDNLYVLDYNDGSGAESTESSRLKIYYSTGAESSDLLVNDLEVPYRIAIASNGDLLISQASGGSPSVLIFNRSLNFIGSLPSIQSPGSITIDSFGFIHVIDYMNRVDFEDFLKYNDLGYLEILQLVGNIQRGINDNAFVIKIYDSNRNLVKTFKDNNSNENNIEFPVDIAFNLCGKMFMDNVNIVNFSLDFDLEIYNRSPSFDREKPLVVACPTDKNVTLNTGSFALLDYRDQNIFRDNCDQNLDLVQNPPAGTPISQNTTVSITAKDDAGNISESCTFTITVNPEEEPDPVTISCAGNETGNFGTDCRFQIPDYTGKATYTTGATITQTPAKGTFVTASTKIVLTATLNGQTDTCEFDLILSDNSPPDITSCPGSRTVTADVNGKFTIPDYTNEIIATDNCSSTVNITQFPAEGAVIDETTEIVFTVTDAGSNGASCSFTLTLAQQSATFANCTDNITRSNESGKCGAVVTFTKPTASDSNGNVEVIQTSGPASGSFFQVGASTLIFEATGSNGVKVECSFDVVVEDKEKPQFNNPCEGVDYTANFEVEEGFTVPNFFQQFGGTDNCDSEVSFQQDPAPGTMVFEEGSFPVNLTIRDDFGNFNTCSFTVTLTSSNSIDLSCNTQFLLEPDENCEFRLPDLSGEYIYGPSDAVVTQSVPQGEILTEDTDIKITVTDNGETLECTIKVILVDYVDPVLSCLPDQTVPFTPSQGYSLPNYISQLTYSDNCEVVSVTQQPFPGTVIRSNQIVQITVTDNFGNTSFCFIDVYLKEEGTPVEISCAEDITRNLDGNCGYLVPDLRNFATATEGATITQSPAEGMVISETQTIRLTATLDGVTDFCEFQLILVDNTVPQLNCPPDQVENFDPAIGFAVPDYTGMAGASDNCGVAEVVQTPTEGTTIFGTKEIKLTAKDQAGNVADCTFTLSLTEEEVLEITCIPDQSETLDGNCQFVIPDYTDQASVNYPSATITQSPEAGVVVTSDTSIVLTASLNGETDICEFKTLLEEDIEAPIANCIASGIFELNTNGTLTITADQIESNSTDNCGIAGFTIDKFEFTSEDLGENVITLTVTDAAGNEATCQTTITIAPNENTGSDFSCVSEVILELDASGNVTLEVGDLYTGDPGNRVFTLSKDNFNCSNLGSNEVTLSYTGSDGSGSCEINVEVVDSINPVLITNNINVSLNAQGQATISPQLINNGSYDNCGEMTFSLNKNTFSCKDIGENVISLRGEDGSGNISTITATVTVTGNCNEIPDNPVDYIYIYPNPTTGPFTFAVPQGWIIEKAEVFDSRGRYLITQDFEGSSSYSMDLTGFQDAVYILLLYTNEGKKIVRVIIH